MTFKHAYLLPILCSVWFYATILITYFISVYRKDVTPIFPYISDTGTWPPESCIFGLLFNIGALFLGITVYIRYRHVHYIIAKEELLLSSLKRTNWISLYFGLSAAFGLAVLANFQVKNVFVVHAIGGVVAFGCGCIYQFTQVHISFSLYPITGNRKVNIARIAFSVISSITFAVTMVFTWISMQQFTGDDPTKWSEDDEGYKFHLTSTVSEWILAFTTLQFIATFKYEFKNIVLSEPALTEVTLSSPNRNVKSTISSRKKKCRKSDNVNNYY